MALDFKCGSFTSSGSGGNQAVTGVGFQPKALILFTTSQTSLGVDTFGVFGMGAYANGQQRCIDARDFHGASAADGAVACETTLIYTRRNFSGGIATPTGTLISLDADGFTIQWNLGHTGFILSYVAIGGADLTNVDLRTVTVPGSTGTQNVTGVGFQPDALIAFGVSHTAAGGRDADPLSWFQGFCDGTTQGVVAAASDEGADPTNTISVQDTGRFVLTLNAATPAVHNEASLVSLDADGFTLNWITRNSSDIFFVLSLKGGSYKVGTGAYKTTTGTQAYTGVGFEPKGVLVMSNGEEVA